jgi:hypothetical protein
MVLDQTKMVRRMLKKNVIFNMRNKIKGLNELKHTDHHHFY